MIVIDESYTIRYSLAGYSQYADFRYSKGVLIGHSFRPSYINVNDIPSIIGLNNISEILGVIKKISNCNQAEIVLKNYAPISYTSKEITKKAEEKVDLFLSSIFLEFFKSEILPILLKNNWKLSYSWCNHLVIIESIEDVWDNINSQHEDSILIDYICNRFIVKVLNYKTELNLTPEHSHCSGDSFKEFFYWINIEELEALNIILKDPNN